MKKYLAIASLFLLVAGGCQNGTDNGNSKPNASSKENTAKETIENASAKQKVPPTKETHGSEDFKKKQQEYTATTNNTTSAYRYIITSEQFSIFGNIVKRSTLSKFIHSSNVTLVAPTNNAMAVYKKYEDWISNNNTDAIDDFVAHYLLDAQYTRKEIEDETEVLNHAGDILKVEGGDGFCSISGSSVAPEYIQTKNGTVLQLDQLYYKP